jgi:aspartate aminotransferase
MQSAAEEILRTAVHRLSSAVGPRDFSGRGRARVPVSAALAANEALTRKQEVGEPVLLLAFGEAGLPVHPLLAEALASAAGRNAYAPVAGLPELREAAAGYWTRRSLPTGAGAVVSGPGSKPLLFALLLAVGADVAVSAPSWVSYAAQATLAGARPHFVPAPPGEGGICDPSALARALTAARAAGRRIGSVIVTLPDNPTGPARPARHRERLVRGRGPARPGHHLRRDLP